MAQSEPRSCTRHLLLEEVDICPDRDIRRDFRPDPESYPLDWSQLGPGEDGSLDICYTLWNIRSIYPYKCALVPLVPRERDRDRLHLSSHTGLRESKCCQDSQWQILEADRVAYNTKKSRNQEGNRQEYCSIDSCIQQSDTRQTLAK